MCTDVCFCQDADNVWWDAFAAEFFDDDATLTLSFCLEDGPKRYCMYLKLEINVISYTI